MVRMVRVVCVVGILTVIVVIKDVVSRVVLPSVIRKGRNREWKTSYITVLIVLPVVVV
jgi:hypothetical protein